VTAAPRYGRAMRRVGLVVGVLGLVACSAVGEPRPAPAPVQAVFAPAPPPLPTTGRPRVWIDDPAALAVITAGGGAFTDLISADDERVMERAVESDIAAAGKDDPAAGVGVRRFSHRLFDARWLAPRGGYQLIAVAARLDKLPFTERTCGDVRLLYRLGYEARVGGTPVASRLPMTVVVVLRGAPRPAGDLGPCAAAAARWMAPPALAGDGLGRWLLAGPLAGVLAASAVDQVLTDVQVVRWPSAVRPDLGGHAEYALRQLRRSNGRLVVSRVDHTPDAARLVRDRAARAALLAWIARPDSLDAIDAGTAIVPAQFLAPRAVSVTPRGFARRANRPFRQIFAPADLAALPLAGRRHIGSPEALLRRLDDLTCQGCHQSRTIAGFHALGVDGPDVVAGNALAVSTSPHLLDEIARRERVVAALVAGTAADLSRPPAARSDRDPGGYGAPCGRGDPGFAAWTCAPGLVCDAYDAPKDDAAVGVCLPPVAQVGDPCEVGPLLPSADARRDRARATGHRACAGAVCNVNRVGFPGGMCTAGCDVLPAGGACGAIALLTPFNNCLARQVPFPRCLREHVSPAGLRACSADRPCREDYVCARTADGGGACTPPYFLFQLRVDGHP
jgi:hypothetical protein